MIKEEDIILEQYKLYIETAEKVSDRRQSSNNFFLSLNSVLLAFTGFLTSLSFALWHIIIAFAGVCISILWLLTLKSFRNLNTEKFKVIHCLEEKLPIKLFTDEWKCLGEGQSRKKYLKLSVVEQGVPIVFMILYLLIIILMLIK
ncbi:hypothetical protein ACFL4V_00145 [Candidatus Latescibacterota bacterium]